MIPAWIEASKEADIPTGLGVDESLKRALELRDGLRGALSAASFPVDAESVETFHALCTLLDQPGDMDPKLGLADCSGAFEFISALDWPSDQFGGREDLLSRFAFLSWRRARQSENPAQEWRWADIYRSVGENPLICENLQRILATPISSRQDVEVSALNDPEVLFDLCQLLRGRYETSPATIQAEAEFFYRYLSLPGRRAGSPDEREYFLGEFAMIAGTACRFLFRRDEAHRWFSRAQTSFELAKNSSANVARLAYQRLALSVEERNLDEILELAPIWTQNLVGLGLVEDSLKCRFLEALAFWETGELQKAVGLFEGIRSDAASLGKDKLQAQAANNAAMVYALLGDQEKALSRSGEALPIFRALNDRVGMMKVQWGIGNLTRQRGKRLEAVEAFREALQQATEIGLRADIAVLHLIVADLFLDLKDERQAEREIHAALPIIEEEQMVPEGMAALSLLRESLRRRRINRQALKDLHGYFGRLHS